MTQTPNISQRKSISGNGYTFQKSSSLVIIDASVDNLELLKAGLKPGAEVVVLHPQLNGIEQITTLISGRKNLQKVHLVSHGSSGSLKLGNSELNLDNLKDYSGQIQAWFANCSDRISLYVYGCQVASGNQGQSFIRELHSLTGANIAAATEKVGSSNNGGIWLLDYKVGNIDSEIVFGDEVIQTYPGTFMEEDEMEIDIPETTVTVEDSESPIDDSVVEPVAEEEILAGDAEASVEVISEGEELVGEETTAEVTVEEPAEGEPVTEVPTEEPVGEETTAEVTIEEPVEGESVTEVPTEELVEEEATAEVTIEEPVEGESVTEVPTEEPVGEGTTAEVPIEEPVEEETTAEVPIQEPVDGEPVTEVPIEEPVEGESVTEVPTEELEEETTAEVTVEEPVDGEPVTEVSIQESEIEDLLNTPITSVEELVDLSAIAGGDTVFTEFTISREASFDNTVDFYEVNADGSVVDESGTTIAVGEAGYAEAALDNRVGLELTAENGETSEFSAELEGGKFYAPILAVDSSFDIFSDGNPDNDSELYFTYSDANVDGFDHVRNSESNVFEFEDLPDGGDEDFNDLVVSASFNNAVTPAEPVVEEPVVDAPVEEVPIEEPVVDAPVEEVPLEEPVAGAPVEEAPIEEPVVDAPVEEAPVEEPIVDAPVEEAPIEEPIAEVPVEGGSVVEESSTLTNFEGAEIQFQQFFPNLETPTSTPITSVVGDGVEFSADEIFASDNPDDNLFIPADIDIDITGGDPGEGSIIYEVGENRPPVTGLSEDFNEGVSTHASGDFNGGVFTDVSGDLPAIENVTLDESVTTFGLESSDVTFTEDMIMINFEGLLTEPGLIAKVDVEFADA